MKTTWRVTAVLLFVAVVAGASLAGADDALVREAAGSNRAQIEQIYSFYCRYNVLARSGDGRPFPLENLEGEYWRSAGMVRQKTTSADGSADRLVREGRAVSLASVTKGGQVVRTGFVAADDGIRGPADPWLVSMFTFLGNTEEPGRYTFDECLSLRQDPWRVTGVRRDGDTIVLATVAPSGQAGSTAEFTFDAKVGYLIRAKRSVIPGAKKTELEAVVSDFVEVQPGIHFPKQITSTIKYGGEVKKVETMTFSTIKVNEPPPAGTFDLALPPGTKVTDELQDTEYTINADGTAGGGEPLKIPALPLSSKGEPVSPRTETREEATSWYWILLPASIVLLGATVVARVVRRWRVGGR